MNTVLKKLINKEIVLESDIEAALYDICDSVHSSCYAECPVYVLNGNKVPECPEEVHFGGCLCFKDGKAMLSFINTMKDMRPAVWKVV